MWPFYMGLFHQWLPSRNIYLYRNPLVAAQGPTTASLLPARTTHVNMRWTKNKTFLGSTHLPASTKLKNMCNMIGVGAVHLALPKIGHDWLVAQWILFVHEVPVGMPNIFEPRPKPLTTTPFSNIGFARILGCLATCSHHRKLRTVCEILVKSFVNGVCKHRKWVDLVTITFSAETWQVTLPFWTFRSGTCTQDVCRGNLQQGNQGSNFRYYFYISLIETTDTSRAVTDHQGSCTSFFRSTP